MGCLQQGKRLHGLQGHAAVLEGPTTRRYPAAALRPRVSEWPHGARQARQAWAHAAGLMATRPHVARALEWAA
jgi:hypothetical protein